MFNILNFNANDLLVHERKGAETETCHRYKMISEFVFILLPFLIFIAVAEPHQEGFLFILIELQA
jgi:hypothetical protein